MRTKIKNWWKAIFNYPQQTIAPRLGSYDGYWEARGRDVVSLSPWQKERTDIALTLMGEASDAAFSVADVGCGDGAVLQYIREKHPNMNGTGIDISKPVLGRVRDAGFETILQDISRVEAVALPLVDYTILFEVIEHVAESELLVQKAFASSRKGVFISIPNSGFFTYRLRLLFGRFPVQWVVHPSEHVRFWTLADVEWWMKALTLSEAVQIIPYQGIPMLNRLFPSWAAAGIVLFIPKAV